MNELTIIKQNGGAYIDSREVAEYVGKTHNHLLRDIRGYCKIIGKFNLSKNGQVDFFLESSYVDTSGRTYPCYLLSKMGCELVANKLTGEKGVLFTAAYVKKFNEMEAAERDAEIKSYARPRLSEFNSAVRNVLSGMSYCGAKPERVMDFLNGVYSPLGIEVRNENDVDFISASFIAEILGIYSDMGRPHSHAVSAIIAKLDVPADQTIIVPYGLVGVMARYKIEVALSVINWLTKNNKPRSISHNDFFYHVRYDPKKSHFFEWKDDVIDLSDDDEEFEYTAEELDAMCGEFGDCDDCPGLYSCCEVD